MPVVVVAAGIEVDHRVDIEKVEVDRIEVAGCIVAAGRRQDIRRMVVDKTWLVVW